MAKIRMVIELEYDDEIMHGDSEEDKEWFFDEILMNNLDGPLVLFSNELGDEVGIVKVLSID